MGEGALEIKLDLNPSLFFEEHVFFFASQTNLVFKFNLAFIE